MFLHVTHTTRYHYPEEAWDSFNELWTYPVDDYRQSLLEFNLELVPATPVRSRVDYYGNRVYDFHLSENHHSLRVEVRAKVVTFASPKPHRVMVAQLEPLKNRFFEYLAPTRRVALDRDWLALMDVRPPDPEEDLTDYLEEVNHRLNTMFSYSSEATEVDTPLEDFVQNRAGVCQDYAHAMLAVLRTAGIPARYASGYLSTGVGAEGSHAWIEAYLPGTGWVGFDPTNDTAITERYVKVAHGRDYDDCPPMRGLRRGGGKEELKVYVHVEQYEP